MSDVPFMHVQPAHRGSMHNNVFSLGSSRVWRLLAAAVMVLLVGAGLLAPAGPAHAATVTATVDGIVYSADDADVTAGATITDYVGSSTVVNIPATVTIAGQDYAVTTIGEDAFIQNGLTEVTIPNSVTMIVEYAFYNNDLTELTIPDSVLTIGDSAFASNDLTEVSFSHAVEIIGGYAFYDNDLTSVTIPNSVTTIGSTAFGGNVLTSVTIGDSVTTIGNSAFIYNDLTEVTIPDSVLTIGNLAFASNDLTSVTIGDSVAEIGSQVFIYNHLTEVTIPDSVTTIGPGAFIYNDLTEVRFTGPVPITMGTADVERPLGDGVGLTVFYPRVFGDSVTPGGYTTPTWHGYNTQPDSVLVSFDAAGGDPVAEVLVDFGGPVTEPVVPTRAGYTFMGWFTTADGDELFDFTGPITADVTLFAGWELDDVVVLDPDDSDQTPVGDDSGEVPSEDGELLATGGTLQSALIAGGLLVLIAGVGLLAIRRRTSVDGTLSKL